MLAIKGERIAPNRLRITTDSLMRQKPHFRFRIVGSTPRVVVADPYYTLLEIAQMAVGILGVFVSVMAILTGNGLNALALGGGVLCLLIYMITESLMIRAESLRGRLSLPGSDLTETICRLSHHTFHPEGITTEDRLGLSPQRQPPRMVWTCTRCGEERWLEPGVSPE